MEQRRILAEHSYRELLSPEGRNWLRNKWIKDGADLIALLDPQPRSRMIAKTFDTDLLVQIVGTHSLQFALQSLTELPDMGGSLNLYGNASRGQV